MATRTYRVDDLDGTSDVTEVGQDTTVSLNGRAVTLDLSDKHFAELEKFLAKYFENGQESTRKTAGAKATGNADADAERNREIRAWRQLQNRDDLPVVNERGRLPKAVVDAYVAEVENAANPQSADVDA
jgi:Lsr2